MQFIPGAPTPSRRLKLVHTEGTVAKVKIVFDPEYLSNPNFTGLFQLAEFGIARLSMASEPSPAVDNSVPAMSVKFLRSGIDSANFVSM